MGGIRTITGGKHDKSGGKGAGKVEIYAARTERQIPRKVVDDKERKEEHYSRNGTDWPTKMDERDKPARWMEDQAHSETPVSWELLLGKKDKKIRKPPPVIKNWFGDDTDDNDTSSDSQEEELSNWSEVDRKRRNTLKMKERLRKRKEKMRNMAAKMQHMVGVGPVSTLTMKHFMESEKKP